MVEKVPRVHFLQLSYILLAVAYHTSWSDTFTTPLQTNAPIGQTNTDLQTDKRSQSHRVCHFTMKPHKLRNTWLLRSIEKLSTFHCLHQSFRESQIAFRCYPTIHSFKLYLIQLFKSISAVFYSVFFLTAERDFSEERKKKNCIERTVLCRSICTKNYVL